MYRKRSVWITWKPERKRYEVGVHWQGRKYRFYQYDGVPHASREVAQDHAGAIRREIKMGIFDPGKHGKGQHSKHAFKDYARMIAKDYQAMAKVGDVSQIYAHSLSQRINDMFIPAFGHLYLQEVSAQVIKDWYYNLIEEKSFTKGTLRVIMANLKRIFSAAYDDHLIDEIPRLPVVRGIERENMNCTLQEHEQELVLGKVPDVHKPIAMFILYEGVRPSEARALMWDCVDLKNRVAKIARTFTGISGNVLQDKTKTGKDRPVALNGRVIEVMRGLPKAMHHHYVFHYKTKPYSRYNLYMILKGALREAGFPHLTPNQAGRHSVATIALEKGVPIRDVQAHLGHADIRTTQKYTHPNRDSMTRVVERRKADDNGI